MNIAVKIFTPRMLKLKSTMTPVNYTPIQPTTAKLTAFVAPGVLSGPFLHRPAPFSRHSSEQTLPLRCAEAAPPHTFVKPIQEPQNCQFYFFITSLWYLGIQRHLLKQPLVTKKGDVFRMDFQVK